MQVLQPYSLLCIDGKSYVISCNRYIYLLSDDLKDKEIIFDNKANNESRFVTFGGYVCAYFKESKEILRF